MSDLELLLSMIPAMGTPVSFSRSRMPLYTAMKWRSSSLSDPFSSVKRSTASLLKLGMSA